jgi:hypothetical protein
MSATIDEPAAKAKPAVAVQKRVIMSLGDKGGTYKSPIVRLVAEMHIGLKTPKLCLVDGDGTVGSLYKFHGRDEDRPNGFGVEAFSLHGDMDDRDRLVNELLMRDHDLVLVDMPAASLSRMRESSARYDFVAALQSCGYRLTVLSPITPYEDPIFDLRDAIEIFDPESFAAFDAWSESNKDTVARPPRNRAKVRVDYVAVVNLGAMKRSSFEIWDDPKCFGRQLLEFVGGVEIEIPRMEQQNIPAKLDKHRLAFRAGETSQHLMVTYRSQLQTWNNAAEAALRSAGDRLGF